ncbi:hypothetical protein AAFC00_000895 [Neodothiora populina]|uniref:RRM domain-containing protein n=1 Tax=Neodothiora populina TaxID=2781224 RepID=A0ABR3PM33_9PEZI
MDINSLLSPQESPTRPTSQPAHTNQNRNQTPHPHHHHPSAAPAPAPVQPPPSAAAAAAATAHQSSNAPLSPLRRPRPGSGKRTSSTLSNEITLHSPPHDAPRSAPSLGYDSIAKAQQVVWNPAYGSHEVRTPQGFVATPGSEVRSPFGTPQLHRPSLQYAGGRAASSPQMETLAEVATLQHPSVSRHSSYVADAHRSPSMSSPSVRMSVHRTLSNVSSSDLVMAEAPSQTPPPRVVAVPSMSDADQRLVHELENYLAKNSYAYDSHVQLINLLHQGLVAHIYDAAGEQVNDPRTYGLLSDLRQAREAMDSRFAVGEDIWKDWINDESLLARTGEERMSVMELCQKAVSEEPSSVTLWLLYGEYVMQTFSVANGQAEGDPNLWTEEDKVICAEVFTREIVLDVWERAVHATEWRIDESNRIWDRYIDWILAEFPEQPTSAQVDQVNAMFMARLQVPHATWSETSQKFWPIVSRYNANTWEEIMATTNEMAGHAKQQFALREEHEFHVRRATESGDKTALYAAFNEYLNWEIKNERKGRVASFNFEVRSSLFERALLRFPTVIDWWLDYADFLVTAQTASPLILPALERATRHCPWSGDLWARRILRSEVERRPYEEVGNVKHKATNSGLLNIGGMEEVLKVYSAWCSYLRRRAFDPENTDDEVDMADMGITGTLEDAGVAGKNIYGDDYKGDPLFRLERIHIKFLTEARRASDARAVWERLTKTQSQNAQFWLAYYYWELLIWSHERMNDGVRLETPENAPRLSTSVLRRALAQRNMDWPEKIIELYTNHFQQHETAEAAQVAEIEARTARYYTQIRRAKEAEAAAEAAATTSAQATSATLESIPEDAPISSKRKRDDEADTNGDDAIKRNKTDDAKPQFEASSSASAQIKRDREHNTITVKDLPEDVEEKRIRQFFGDCGEILSINITTFDNMTGAFAAVEFSDHEAVLAAKTRDGKDFHGSTIRIQAGSMSTIYVTNYPADFDEVKLREMFQDFGTIISVRLPSLKYNQRRRFCYIQFLTSEEARAATSMNGKAIDGQHQLVALISDPDAKKGRIGATSEGREVHVGNVDWNASEQDIKEAFSSHGNVESVRRIMKNGRFLGSCFVIFSKAAEANAAAEALNNKPFMSRLLRVTVATDRSSAANQNTSKIVRNASASVEPEDASQHTQNTNNPRRASIASNSSNTGAATTITSTELNADTARTKYERTIALVNLPDTVNDARIQSHLSQYGPLHKIVMRRERNGALVEFVNLQDAGKVGMGIDCSPLGPDVRVGDASELTTAKKGKSVGGGSSKPVTAMRPAQASVARPGRKSGVMRGGRGGLGFRRGGGGVGLGSRPLAAASAGEEGDKAMTDAAEAAPAVKKGNSDFRALFEKSRESASSTTGVDTKTENGGAGAGTDA